jgi:class 3 adenylate cyclase/pimeloyl-ACP methyl ester carboxylesterase
MDIPETKYACNGDVHLAYQAFGSGDITLVGAPPIMSNIEVIWEEANARRFLTRLASFSNFVHYDKRGQGMSDRDTGVPTIDERVDDLRAVLDAEGIERCSLGGISEGGSTAALFAATYPERVDKLVLWEAPPRLLTAPDYPCGIDPQALDIFVELWAQHMGTPISPVVPVFCPSMIGDETFLKWINRYERQCTSPGGLAAAWRWIRAIDIRHVLPSIQAPTLVMARRRKANPAFTDEARYVAGAIPGAQYVEFEGEDHLPWIGNQDGVVDAIEQFLVGTHRPEVDGTDRVLATVLFTDIVGSTEQAAQLGDRSWRDRLDRHDAIASDSIAAHRGRYVKSTGDGLLATFDGPTRAVQCAMAMRRSLSAAGIPIRAGLHTGEIELRGDDVGGIAVHIAARVEAQAGPGEIFASRTVKDLVTGSLFCFEDRGAHQLKGVPAEWQLFAVAGT